jgi:queuosine precursor transporter
MKRAYLGFGLAMLYVSTIFLANWAITRWGVVSVGFGLYAPAGVYFAGLAFTLRDAVHEILGRTSVVAAILLGAYASWQVAPAFAVASGTAFLVSELADMAVYTPLRERRPATALLASNVVGAMLDSAIFLWLAFSSLQFFWGQVVGKIWVTLPFVVLVYFVKQRQRAGIEPASPRSVGTR